MKKVEQERKQEMKLSRLQAVQRVKQYKQVSTVEGTCISEGRGQRQLELRAVRVRVCQYLFLCCPCRVCSQRRTHQRVMSHRGRECTRSKQRMAASLLPSQPSP